MFAQSYSKKVCSAPSPSPETCRFTWRATARLAMGDIVIFDRKWQQWQQDYGVYASGMADNDSQRQCGFTVLLDDLRLVELEGAARAPEDAESVGGASCVSEGAGSRLRTCASTRCSSLGVDVKVIITPPCIFCIENN